MGVPVYGFLRYIINIALFMKITLTIKCDCYGTKHKRASLLVLKITIIHSALLGMITHIPLAMVSIRHYRNTALRLKHSYSESRIIYSGY
jgi:hypothetical protein